MVYHNNIEGTLFDVDIEWNLTPPYIRIASRPAGKKRNSMVNNAFVRHFKFWANSNVGRAFFCTVQVSKRYTTETLLTPTVYIYI